MRKILSVFLSLLIALLPCSIGLADYQSTSPGALSTFTPAVSPYNTSATTVPTMAILQAQSSLTMSTMPMTITGGTYSFDSFCTNASTVYFASGGVISSILSITNGGTNCKVGDVLRVNNGNGDAMIQVTNVNGTAANNFGIVYGGTGYTIGNSALTPDATSLGYTWALSGTLTSNALILVTGGTFLTQSNKWNVRNNTTGAYNVKFQLGNATADNAVGVGVIIPQATNVTYTIDTDGETDVWCDGGAVNNVCGLAAINGTLTNVNLLGNTTANNITASGTVNAGSVAIAGTNCTITSSGQLTNCSFSGSTFINFQAHLGAGQAFNSTTNQLVFNVVDFDTANAYNNATGNYTVPATGYYELCTYVHVAGAANSPQVIITKSSASMGQEFTQQTTTAAQTVGYCTHNHLTVNDILQVYMGVSAGGQTADATYSWFSVRGPQ
jgi:hypothetical protein